MTVEELIIKLRQINLLKKRDEIYSEILYLKKELITYPHKRKFIMSFLMWMDRGIILPNDANDIIKNDFPELLPDLEQATKLGIREYLKYLFLLDAQNLRVSYTKEYIIMGLDSLNEDSTWDDIEIAIANACQHMLDIDIQNKVKDVLLKLVKESKLTAVYAEDLIHKFFPILTNKKRDNSTPQKKYNLYGKSGAVFVDFTQLGNDWANKFNEPN